MTESEKMHAGEWYFASDKGLSAQRMDAKQACHALNALAPDNIKARKQALKALLPNAKGAWIEPNFFCDYGYNIRAQNGLFVNHNVVMLDGATINFGANVFIAPNVVISTTSHHMDAQKRSRGLCRSKPICIGNNVWIGANVSILGGVNIPDNTVVPAGSVLR
ncbi:sugar O-acetyltransferase [Ningiella sp. W23]|uniref:sugar O-acetyltransferase n=1 Tax=Ningiella sp. W23 TaxID=3023715 RepID=UPI0037581425